MIDAIGAHAVIVAIGHRHLVAVILGAGDG